MNDVLPDANAKTVPLYTAQLVLAATCIVAAIGHAYAPKRIDQTTAAFLALAAVVLFFDRLTKFKGFGIELEQEIRKELNSLKSNVESVKDKVGVVQENVSNVQEDVNQLGKTTGPGSKQQVPPLVRSLSASAETPQTGANSDDPNKNQFGSDAARNQRILEATIRPLRGPDSPLCQVEVRVRSTSPEKRPLAGVVTFYLHPTFGSKNVQTVEVVNGIAELTFVSYGAFTIGAEADDGETELELDLIEVPGGTSSFREN